MVIRKLAAWLLAVSLGIGAGAWAGLETGTYISDLTITNPTAGDPVSQADDHIRLVKSVLQNQFPDASTGPIYGLTTKTVQASTSGTSIDFTSIPSWARRVTVLFAGVSTNGTSPIIIQLGDSGGVETSGYLSSTSNVNFSGTDADNFTNGFSAVSALTAGDVFHGSVVLERIDAATFKWVAHGVLGASSAGGTFSVGGSKALSAALDRVRITTSGGANTFDAGAINVLYE